MDVSNNLVIVPEDKSSIVQNNKTSNRLLLSYIAYILYLIGSYLSDIRSGNVFFSYLIMSLVPFCINGAKLSKNLICLFLIILAYPFVKQTIPIFFVFFFVYIFRNVSLQRVAKITLWSYISFLVIQCFLLRLGLVHNDTYSLFKGETNTFGFGNSNVFAAILFGIIICIYVGWCKKSFWQTILIIIVINQILLSLTSSRTPWLATISLLITAILIKINVIKPWTRYLLALLPLILTLLCFYFIKNSSNFMELDFIMSGRLEILHDTLDKFTIMNWLTGYMSNEALDCGYLGIVANGGILWLLFFLYTTSVCLYYRFNYVKIYIPIIVAFLVSGIAENTFCGFKPYSILLWMILLRSLSYTLYSKSYA